MKPSEIIKLARRQTGCTEDIVTTDEAYKFLNFVIEDFGNDIRTSDSWYWFDILEIPVTAWQSSYTFEGDEEIWSISTKFPISKIQSVWLLDTKTWKYRDLPVHFVDKVDINKFENQWEPKVCFITRTELNLIPKPKTSTQMQVWGFNYNWELKSVPSIEVQFSWWTAEYLRIPEWDVEWQPKPYARHREGSNYRQYTWSEKPNVWDYLYENPDWTWDTHEIIAYEESWEDTEENIWIPKRWHYILVEWLKYRMYGNMWVNFETARTNSRAFYDSEKNKAIQNIVDRWQLADTAYFPDLNFLNY